MSLYDLVVVGGGSGGLAAARRAAKVYGKRVALVEGGRLGGTCVNAGCVPKKIMYNAALLAEHLSPQSLAAYSFSGDSQRGASTAAFTFNWEAFVEKREAYIRRLNETYTTNLAKDNVTVFRGTARMAGPTTVSIDSDASEAGGPLQEICGRHVVIATGSHPIMSSVPGSELGMTSDDFFKLKRMPKNVAIIGSGYIGVELAGILHALGATVSLWCRRDGVLSHFDSMLSETLTSEMRRIGIRVLTMTTVTSIRADEEDPEKRIVCFDIDAEDCSPQDAAEGRGGAECIRYDAVIWAIGRGPNSGGLGLEALSVAMDRAGHIVVDELQQTSVPALYAIGDVCGQAQLTPVAIAAGRRLVDRLFGGPVDAKVDYSLIPTVVFAHPSPVATVGLSEEEARRVYGGETGEDVRTYASSFVNMHYAMMDSAADKAVTRIKLVCVGKGERIVGLHMIGKSVDEILQGFAVAIKMGATKADFDRCIAIHPTASEELVLLT